MLTSQDLQNLYDLAKAAPMQRAADSHFVSDLFKRVEAELQAIGEQTVLNASKEIEAKRKPPESPPKPVKDAVAKAVAKAS